MLHHDSYIYIYRHTGYNFVSDDKHYECPQKSFIMQGVFWLKLIGEVCKDKLSAV